MVVHNGSRQTPRPFALSIVPLAGAIFGSGLMLFDLKALYDYFYELATEQPDFNRASRERPRNSINNQKQKNDEDRERVVYLSSKKAQI
jgi:hypothetical protein